MQCIQFILRLLTLSVAWTFAIAQSVGTTLPSGNNDDDFDPLDFEEAQNYLEKYNYFHGPKPAQRFLQSPADIREAIEEMQDFNGLTRTGILDPETMKKIRSPRCGVADFVGVRKNVQLVRRRRRYALAGQKWPQKALTYRILNYTPDLTRANQRQAIAGALQTWADQTPLTFKEVTRGTADIVIQFARGEHGDGYPFDGRGGTLAHAYFPGKGIGGDAHFDDHEYFSHKSYRGTNLFLVAAHELGHSLGLAHSSNSRALMAPYYQGYKPNFKLPLDDIKGIQRLYGKAPARPRPPVAPGPGPVPKPPGPGPKPPAGPGPNPPVGPNPPTPPDGCGVSFQAAMNLENRIFLFQGANYWRIEENGTPSRGYPKKITSYWRNAPTNIDAAFLMQTTENVVFFKGNKWYEYRGPRLLRHGALTELGLPATVTKLDAAVVWEGNSMPYFFVGNEYYRFNEERGRVDAAYPKPITPNWVNIPGNVDATFGKRGHTYFIKGQSYYKFDDNAVRRVLGPKDFGSDFLRCTGRRSFQQEGSGGSANQSKSTFASVLVPIVFSMFYLLL